MLDSDDAEIEIDALRKRYEHFCPSEKAYAFSEALNHMTEAFVKVRDEAYVGWIHPTCRDLTTSNLAASHVARSRFLSRCSLGGLRLALSVGGGRSGQVTAPLLASEPDWHAVESNEVWIQDRRSLRILLEALRTSEGNGKESLFSKLREAATRIVQLYQNTAKRSGKSLYMSEVELLLRIRKHLKEKPRILYVGNAMRECCEDVLALRPKDDPWDAEEIESFEDLCSALLAGHKRLARLVARTKDFRAACVHLKNHGHNAFQHAEGEYPDEIDDCSDLADQYQTLSESYERIADFSSKMLSEDFGLIALANDFDGEADALREHAREIEGKTADDNESPGISGSTSIGDSRESISELFRDL
jgi:hypothetical protein